MSVDIRELLACLAAQEARAAAATAPDPAVEIRVLTARVRSHRRRRRFLLGRPSNRH